MPPQSAALHVPTTACRSASFDPTDNLLFWDRHSAQACRHTAARAAEADYVSTPCRSAMPIYADRKWGCGSMFMWPNLNSFASERLVIRVKFRKILGVVSA